MLLTGKPPFEGTCDANPVAGMMVNRVMIVRISCLRHSNGKLEFLIKSSAAHKSQRTEAYKVFTLSEVDKN